MTRYPQKKQSSNSARTGETKQKKEQSQKKESLKKKNMQHEEAVQQKKKSQQIKETSEKDNREMKSGQKQVLIIGAGASGLMAGICAARQGAAVTILEANDKPGRKLLVTGNGRCNLTNLAVSGRNLQACAPYRSSGDPSFWQQVLAGFDADAALKFFGELGLLTQERNGGVYPMTDQATTVLEVLLLEVRRLKIKCKYREKAEQISHTHGKWQVHTAGWHYEADALILACGSSASPSTGASESGYELAKALGHMIRPVFPALVPLTVRESCVKKLAGLRSKAVITLTVHGSGAEETARKIKKDTDQKIAILNTETGQTNGCAVYQESGELQWTDYGISGIVVFQLSRRALEGLNRKRKVTVEIDCLPSLTETRLCDYIFQRKTGETAAELFTGILPSKMTLVLLEQCGIRPSMPREELTRQQISRLAQMCKHFRLTVTGGKSFDMAQACAGGVDTSEINPVTMESRIHRGLYFAGELLDVDGVCGGFNLQWAWASGYTAGTAASR